MASFKQWLSVNETDIPDGAGFTPTQVHQKTAEVGKEWLAQKKNLPAQARIVTKNITSPSSLPRDLLTAGQQAVYRPTPDTSPKMTTGPQVGEYIGGHLGVRQAVKPAKYGISPSIHA